MAYDDRRSFLKWATNGLGAIFAAVLGFPAVCYLIDPRNRQAPESSLRLVDGVRLDDPALAPGRPMQGVIRAVRVDGWTLHPDDVIGRVWVVKTGQGEADIRVFTTICPHLGCSVNLAETCFQCPCHNGRFEFASGERIMPNPAQRGMDELEWHRDEFDPQRIHVRYQNFRAGKAEKDPIT